MNRFRGRRDGARADATPDATDSNGANRDGDRDRGMAERRIGSRAVVELEARWRRAGTRDEPTLALLFDLSVRGARLAGWNPLRLAPGERIELSLADGSAWFAEVRRAIGDGEYAVQFTDVADEVKQRIIATVGNARAGERTHWAPG